MVHAYGFEALKAVAHVLERERDREKERERIERGRERERESLRERG